MTPGNVVLQSCLSLASASQPGALEAHGSDHFQAMFAEHAFQVSFFTGYTKSFPGTRASTVTGGTAGGRVLPSRASQGVLEQLPLLLSPDLLSLLELLTSGRHNPEQQWAAFVKLLAGKEA